ncbi:MAG: hypothetical protein LBT99_03395 [Bifidobacteriaceae bacterium]|jgi:hypothetical protein|nr:hypothetical protein [Bifidobacteriaceae bacterium]
MAESRIIANRFKIKRRIKKIDEFEIYEAYDTLLADQVFLFISSKPIFNENISKIQAVNSEIILPVLANYEIDKQFLYVVKYFSGKSLKSLYPKKTIQNNKLTVNYITNLCFRLAKECERVGRSQFYPSGLRLETVLVDKDNKIGVIGQGLIINKSNYNPLGNYSSDEQSKMCADDLMFIYKYLLQRDGDIVNNLEISNFSPKSVIDFIDFLQKHLMTDEVPAEPIKLIELVKSEVLVNSQELKVQVEQTKEQDEVSMSKSRFQPKTNYLDGVENKSYKKIKLINLVFIYILLSVALLVTLGFVLVLTGVIK